jgi:hypothetical protein
MRAFIVTAACLVALGTVACTPAFNWREASITSTPLTVLFPCKPEKASRTVTMAGLETELHMAYCDTDGVTAAVGHARIADPALVKSALAHWRNATLATMRVTAMTPSGPTGVDTWGLPEALSVDASGTTADGKPQKLKAVWFARDGEVYAALWYGASWSSDTADAFFGSLKFK